MARFLFLILIAVMTAPAIAGSLCGLVTDDISGAPVAEVGIFIHQGGDYTGYYATTDMAGLFCVNDLLAGTYLLEIRVDAYLTFWRDGVIVSDTSTNVDVPVALPAVGLSPPWPNPASSSVKIRMEIRRQTTVELGVYDTRGRLLRRWATVASGPGSYVHEWDGRDHAGHLAPDGLYLIRAHTSGSVATRRVLLSR